MGNRSSYREEWNVQRVVVIKLGYWKFRNNMNAMHNYE